LKVHSTPDIPATDIRSQLEYRECYALSSELFMSSKGYALNALNASLLT